MGVVPWGFASSSRLHIFGNYSSILYFQLMSCNYELVMCMFVCYGAVWSSVGLWSSQRGYT